LLNSPSSVPTQPPATPCRAPGDPTAGSPSAGTPVQTTTRWLGARGSSAVAGGWRFRELGPALRWRQCRDGRAQAPEYPDLKANQNFLGLQEELTSTENKIAFARQAYNDAAMTYNTKIESFPSNLVAGNFGFKQEPLFQVTDEKERQAPQVKF
jgi:hypothetical protein